MSESEIYIHTEHLSFSYESDEPDPTPALRDVSVDVRRGEYVAVLGHNGSGKSTFAKLLNLMLEPTGGKLVIGGTDLSCSSELTEEELFAHRRRVGMVFQNPDNQLVATLVEEDVAFGPENLGVPNPELRERVDAALETVGMTEYAHHEPHRLSGGQKQRVAIAGVIAMLPECIVFDESTAMLDPSGRREVLDMLRKLNRERGMTVLNITHYMNEAAEADRILVINDGSLCMDGTPDEIFARRDELLAIGLEVPQCTELLHRLRAAGVMLDNSHIASVEDCADALTAVLKGADAKGKGING